jgi:hypothetical protein
MIYTLFRNYSDGDNYPAKNLLGLFSSQEKAQDKIQLLQKNYKIPNICDDDKYNQYKCYKIPPVLESDLERIAKLENWSGNQQDFYTIEPMEIDV